MARWRGWAVAAVVLAAGCSGTQHSQAGEGDGAAQARAVCHAWRNIPVAETSAPTSPALRARLAELRGSAERAAAADRRWHALASAVSDIQTAVAAAQQPATDRLALIARLNRDDTSLTTACAAADPQDGWGTSVDVSSGAMEPTIRSGDRVSYDKPRSPTDIRRGTIIVFSGPSSWTFGSAAQFIKRVIGLGGDHVVCCDRHGDITVNGVPLHERYLFAGDKPSAEPFDVTVPHGCLWVMGDHRSASADSRAHLSDRNRGCIPVRNVVGIVTRISAPASRARPLPLPNYRGL